MCTLTVVHRPLADAVRPGLRIVCNRDESVLRPPARPPELLALTPRRILAPVDPVGGGTWIGASESGLVAVLMNVYVAQAETEVLAIDPAPAALPPTSRGTIIPHVLAAADLLQAAELADRLEIGRFEPFRLLIFDRQRSVEVLWSAGQLIVGQPTKISIPQFFTSSGLGDDVVARPRRSLFDEMFDVNLSDPATWPAAQDAFHRHVWPGREFASVWMTRAEARTQSITWVELGERAVIMRYAARRGESNELGPASEQTLPLL